MLNVDPEEWPLFEELDRKRAHLHKDGTRATYGDLLAVAPPSLRAELAPARHAKRHGAATAALGRLQEALKTAELDVVVIVGDDQHEVYHDANMPSVLIYRGDTIANVPNRTTRKTDPDVAWRPDWAKRASARYYEERETRHYPVHAKLARHLTAALIDREFDISSADALPEGEGEGHAFAFVHKRIMDRAAIPVVPVFLNTYYPPNQPSPRRCYKLGQAIRGAVEDYPEELRVGVVASGGLSHFTIDEDLDNEVIRALREKDAEALQSLPRQQLNSGSSEIRNWICAAGALEHLDLEWVHYTPGYRTPAGTGTGLCFGYWA
ncbi:MAG: extradiol ring-cleavage dioxygenase [Proteobacteria bacterium]|nr:extradiol ring-cleavage dioxygenase [Pseudomonadota bacterium]